MLAQESSSLGWTWFRSDVLSVHWNPGGGRLVTGPKDEMARGNIVLGMGTRFSIVEAVQI